MEDKEYFGHCVRCKGKKKLLNPMQHTLTNNKTRNKSVNMVKGRCPDCDGIVYVVIGHQ